MKKKNIENDEKIIMVQGFVLDTQTLYYSISIHLFELLDND